MFKVASEPPDFEGEGGFVANPGEQSAPIQPQQQQPKETTFQVTTAPNTSSAPPLTAITSMSAQPLSFTMDAVMTPNMTRMPTTAATGTNPTTNVPAVSAQGLTAQQAKAIGEFTNWSKPGSGKSSGYGKGIRDREFEFVAYIGKYAGGDWNSTIGISDGKVTRGSLPNLLWIITQWSKDKIKTNERNVSILDLSSDEIFRVRPPFIFLTGTRDFKLTDKEVENLRKYVQLGGCIWGDASLPGLRSRFDIAFRREMRRVIPDVDKDFEPLPPNHDIYTKGYYPEIKQVVPGLNYYAEPVFALKIYGEIAVIYTANDYGDMWQTGLDENGKIDFSRNEKGGYIAINKGFLDYNGLYVYNMNPAALTETYKFGINIITHLLTRWEDAVKRAPKL